MASGGVGSLSVTLGLDAAQYTQGLTKAEADARRFGEAIGTNVRNAVLQAAAVLKALELVSQVPAIFQKSVDSIASFQDLSDKIGDTAENVAKLQKASDVSGVSLESVAAASIKLTASLSKGGEGAQTVAAGLDAIGLSAKDFKQLSPVAQIDAVAKALGGYQDGAGKTAVAVALYGKSGAELLPILNDLAEQGELQVGLSAKQIAAADDFTKAQARSRGEITQFLRVLSVDSLPAIAGITGAIKTLIGQFSGLNSASTDLQRSSAILDWAEGGALAVAALGESMVAVAKTVRAVGGSFQSVYADIKLAEQFTPVGMAKNIASGGANIKEALDNRAKVAKEANDRYIDFWNSDGSAATKAIKKSFDDQRKALTLGAGGGGSQDGPRRPEINTSKLLAADPGAAAAQKKTFENALKLIESQVKREDEALQTRNRMLDLQNGANLISFQDYYDGRRQALSTAVTKEAALYDQEIAKLTQVRDAAAKGADREEAQGKINDILEKKAKLQRDAANEGTTLAFQEAKAYQDLQRTMDGVNASILEYQGRARDAAALRFDSSNADLRKRLEAQGDIGALAGLGDLRSKTLAQAEYNDEATKASDILARLQVAEQRVNTAQQLGTISEVDGLTTLGQLRTAAVSQLEAIIGAEEAIAKAGGTSRLVLQADQARAALDQLRATADPLGQKFTEIFSTSAGDAFADFIAGSKSASEAFKSFAQTVISQLSRMAGQAVASNIFGGVSSGGSLLGLLGGAAKAFGGTSAIASTASALPGDSLDNFLKLTGSRAVGGGVAPDGMYRVDEQGPEIYSTNGRSYLMTGGSNGTIQTLGSSGGSGGGLSVVVNNNVSGVDVQARQTPRRDGGMQLEILVNAVTEQAENRITGNIGDRVGPAYHAIIGAMG